MKQVLRISDFVNSHEFINWLEIHKLLSGYVTEVNQPEVNVWTFAAWLLSVRVLDTVRIVAMRDGDKAEGFMVVELQGPPAVAEGLVSVSHLYCPGNFKKYIHQLVAEVRYFKTKMKAQRVGFTALNPCHVDGFVAALGLKDTRWAVRMTGEMK